LTEAACGRWHFTWTAFRVDCDPQSSVRIIEGFDLGPDGLAEGMSYLDPMAIGPGTVRRVRGTPDGARFRVELAVDPARVRREEAESDLVLAELQKRSLTLDAALEARSTEVISGSIVIDFESDYDGRIRRQTKTLTTNIRGPDGVTNTRTVTQTLERRRL